MKEFVKQKIVLHNFALRDTKTSFGPLMVYNNVEECKRDIAQSFVKALKAGNGAKLADCELYYIGDYDLETGKFTSELEKICDVKDLIQFTGNVLPEEMTKALTKQVKGEVNANEKRN